MSGIVGSKLNIRGSGRVAKLGTDGQVLTSAGAGTSAVYEDAAGGGLDWQSVVTGATLTAVAGNAYPINTTSNACTVTLPASASVGDTIKFVDYARNWGTNALTINQNSLNFQGSTSPNPVYDTNSQAVTLTYVDTTQGWIPTVDDDVTFETPQNYNVEYVSIGGGGKGGSTIGGAGGAGGFLTSSTLSLEPPVEYTITIGAGQTDSNEDNGDDTTIAGTGLTTITALGGGKGGNHGSTAHGKPGGSGGGGGANGSSGQTTQGGAGTSGQGNTGGTANSDNGGGGGGGKGAVGSNSGSGGGAAGGAGLANSITGSSVTYAGGGGGGGRSGYGAGSAGSGGGGAGGNYPSNNGGDGTANKGGGGGGPSGDGGSGVVILKIADANYSGTTTGSPEVDTSTVTDYTILKFTGTGSYTG